MASDGPLIKAVRLRALEVDPLSFGSTLAHEAAFSDSDWADWAVGDASGEDTATLLAMNDGEPVGMVATYRDEKRRSLFHIVAIWVAPEARRAGIGQRLLHGIEEWIASNGGTCIQLSVADAAPAAAHLYKRAGYEPDGDCTPSPHNPGVMHVSVRKRLTG